MIHALLHALLTFVAIPAGVFMCPLIPGVVINIKDVAPSRSLSIDTGTWFVLGTSDQGPLTPVLIRSMQEFVTWFGQRASYSLLYDSLDTFFHEGGRRAYVSRVVGPGVVTASRTLLDVGAGNSLIITAIGPGSYGNNFKVGVVAGVGGGTFQLQITDLANVVLEQSPDLADQNAAVVWAANSSYIRAALGATVLNPAVVAPAALAGGTDDRANITDTQRQAALDLFVKDLGPGQVSYPGNTSATVHAMIGLHCSTYRRLGIVDFQDTFTLATLTAAAVADRTYGRWLQGVAPWARVPGVVPNTFRTVPYSAVQAGIYARNDTLFSPNKAGAGDDGVSRYSTGLSQNPWDGPTRGSLNDAGVTVALVRFGAVRTYGNRSLVSSSADPTWVGVAAARLLMAYSYRADAIMEAFMFEEIDGFGRMFARVRGQLIALANEYYTLGSLYGPTPGDAFVVVCDDSNNTSTTIANRELHASVGLRVSENAELVYLDLVRVPVSQQLAA